MKPIELEKVAFQRDDRVPRRKLSVARVAVPQCRSAAVPLSCRHASPRCSGQVLMMTFRRATLDRSWV